MAEMEMNIQGKSNRQEKNIIKIIKGKKIIRISKGKINKETTNNHQMMVIIITAKKIMKVEILNKEIIRKEKTMKNKHKDNMEKIIQQDRNWMLMIYLCLHQIWNMDLFKVQ